MSVTAFEMQAACFRPWHLLEPDGAAGSHLATERNQVLSVGNADHVSAAEGVKGDVVHSVIHPCFLHVA